MKVFITRQIPEIGIKKLKDKGYEVEVSPFDRVLTKEELKKGVKAADAVLCLLTDQVDGEVLESAGDQLKIVANYAVGYNNLDVEAAKKKGVMMTNTPGVLTETVAEHTIALLFAIAKRVVEADEFIRQGKFDGWAPMLFLGIDVRGKTLGIVGLGQIGFEVAKRMKDGFGLKLVYYDVKRNEAVEKELAIKYRDLDDLLKESDFVSVHVPLVDQTRHLIDKQKLALMKKTAFLINTSRGPVVDEAALVEALKKGQIAGAALDVFEEEPKLAEGLAELPNTVLTPHTASATQETRSKMSEIAADNIIAALEGQEPPNLIRV